MKIKLYHKETGERINMRELGLFVQDDKVIEIINIATYTYPNKGKVKIGRKFNDVTDEYEIRFEEENPEEADNLLQELIDEYGLKIEEQEYVAGEYEDIMRYPNWDESCTFYDGFTEAILIDGKKTNLKFQRGHENDTFTIVPEGENGGIVCSNFYRLFMETGRLQIAWVNK